MRSVVVDASAVIGHLLAPAGEGELEALGGPEGPHLCAPQLFQAEALSAIGGLCARGAISAQRGRTMLELCRTLPVKEYPHGPLVVAAFERRENFSAYDALYVVLAESLGAPLLTADRRLADAVRRFTSIELLGAPA